MTSLSRAMAAIILAVASSGVNAAPTVYAFDSISRIDLDTKTPSVTGILRNTTTPITVSFGDNVSGDYRFAVSRCVPVFLNMMDKAGRYYLNLTVDPTVTYFGLISCGLELRS
jgi:hypothetical protein